MLCDVVMTSYNECVLASDWLKFKNLFRKYHTLLRFRTNTYSFSQREGNFMSTSSRDQVLLMYRAAQKNKTKAGQMLVGKGRKENLNYYPGMLAGTLSERNSDAVITDFEVFLLSYF